MNEYIYLNQDNWMEYWNKEIETSNNKEWEMCILIGYDKEQKRFICKGGTYFKYARVKNLDYKPIKYTHEQIWNWSLNVLKSWVRPIEYNPGTRTYFYYPEIYYTYDEIQQMELRDIPPQPKINKE